MSVGVIKDGKIISSKGFGVRSLTTKQPMDDNTLVEIASNSKGFTCTALAILENEGKLNWDDRSYDADSYIIFNYDENGKTESA